MADVEKLVINNALGDGSFLAKLPPILAKVARNLGLRSRNMRQTRLLRSCVRILPTLRKLEAATIEPDKLILSKLRFSQALHNATAVERSLKLFTGAWQSGLIEIIGPDGEPLKAGDKRKMVGSCGMSVGDVEKYLLYEAARALMVKHPNFNLNIPGMLTGNDPLSKLYLLQAMEPSALARLQKGMGKKFSDIFKADSEPLLHALTKLKAYHVAGLQTAMGKKFGELMDWDPLFITAVAEAFTCPEQVKDLGEYILMIKDPESVRAIGAWELRDISHKVNEDRRAAGKKVDDQPHYDTDIGVVKKMLGREFGILMEQPAAVLEGTERLVQNIRKINSKNERADRIEEFKQLVSRYLTYLTGEAVAALRLSGDGDTIEVREALGILEGLWTKERVGRKFFEQHLKTPVGIQALDSLVLGFIDMKKRGSIKADSDVASVIATSDLFDSHLSAIMR